MTGPLHFPPTSDDDREDEMHSDEAEFWAARDEEEFPDDGQGMPIEDGEPEDETFGF